MTSCTMFVKVTLPINHKRNLEYTSVGIYVMSEIKAKSLQIIFLLCFGGSDLPVKGETTEICEFQ